MLSGTSTQSPVSSVLTMPTVSMPSGSMGSTALTGAIPEFMSVAHESLNSPSFKTEAGKNLRNHSIKINTVYKENQVQVLFYIIWYM